MEIKKMVLAGETVLALSGRLDTTTAPLLEKEINDLITTTVILVLDFEKLEYLSSAGLRVLLNTQKNYAKRGKFIIRNVNDVIMDVFDMTGFSAILTIE